MSLTQGRHFSISIGNAIATLGTTTTFKAQIDAVGTNEVQFAPVSKEIEFKEPEITTNEVMLLGSTGGNQNSELDPQAPTKGEFTGTLILTPEADNGFDLLQFAKTAGTGASGYTRYNYASAAPTAGVAIVIVANQGSGKCITSWLLNNAVVETLGGVKTDADGHATQDIKVTAAADDCHVEFDANGGT